jgi:predicted nucleotidyltransferase
VARQKRTTHSLARLFPNPAMLDVLGLVLIHPDEQFYQREIAERVGTTVLQAQRALKRIQDAGLVEKTRRGNRAYYKAHRQHPAYEDLRKMLLKTVGLGDQLREALRSVEGHVRLAFVYGSMASGTDIASSDVDLFIVGQLSSREAARLLGPLGRSLDREFNPTIYPEKEFRSKARSGNPFIREVLSGPKIWLVGGSHELAALVERSPAPAAPILARRDRGPVGHRSA